ncbi:hypothetical protein [Effusibacillus lacus]|uniref:DNA-binding response regulator n=1 Tax=Effusibacillus lacus TaxID=1348429 RepID=A0A292YKN3_9BACL|nr:hypothetical protein [Effusibacillus lacus]TCS75300.1 hypothetical protein EDD64_10851 [Effusibacillus lacus]GAX89736.1 hypothetical protein EFBL_1361 [Effusibacillus lacus]
MQFEQDFKEFLQLHLERSTGERLRRLNEGLGHAETLFLKKVWWQAFGNFNNLYPQYEVSDFKDGYRYLDFAYIRSTFRVAIEIDGYGPHWRDLTQTQFADHLMRQNYLIIDGWWVLRFSYDDISKKPRYCQQTIQQLIGKWLGFEVSDDRLTAREKEIVRLAFRLGRPITPLDVCEGLGIKDRHARKLLHSLVDKKWLSAASGIVRIRSFKLNMEGKELIL